MKIGLQTISWGPNVRDMKCLAQQVQYAGYDGIEIAQNVNTLGDARQLRQLLKDHSLTPTGLAVGELSRRVEYGLELQIEYISIDEWDEEGVRAAIEMGMQVGLHPHLYKDIDTIAAADEYLRRFPELGLIVDTAHLYLVGDDIGQVFQEYADRVLAVHLKDWTRSYGITPHRFMRGFTALGTGILGDLLEEAVGTLKKSGYDNWIIVEQDTAHGDPLVCAKTSRDWLRSFAM